MHQTFSLKHIFHKSLEYAKNFFACFVNLEKAYGRVRGDMLWKVLQNYGSIDGPLLIVLKSLICQPEVYVRVNGKQSKSFYLGVGLRRRCVLSPLLFII